MRLQATNIGRDRHNVGVRGGPISGDLLPGASLTLDLGQMAPGTYELYCDLPKHVESGMTATLTITEPTSTTAVGG